MSVTRYFVIFLTLSMANTIALSAEEAPPFQKIPITLSADKSLPGDLQKGPNFQVDDGIINDGLSPYDCAAWTDTLDRKEKSTSEILDSMSGVTGKELWIAGRVSHPARTAIESRGWIVKEKVWAQLVK